MAPRRSAGARVHSVAEWRIMEPASGRSVPAPKNMTGVMEGQAGREPATGVGTVSPKAVPDVTAWFLEGHTG